MTKIKDLRKQLNLSQIDLAILLKTTRSQISLFELGLRDLPTKSNIILADILQFLHQEKTNPINNSVFQKEENAQTKTALETMLQNNKYQKFILDKKRKAAEKKYHNALKAVRLADYLEKNTDKLNKSMAQVIRNGALSNLKTTNQSLLTQYLIKKEVLLKEEKIVLEHLKNLS